MKNTENISREIQFLEQNLQNILFQKQAFQIELSEIKESLKELENSRDEVFKVIGQIMVKSDSSKIKDEFMKSLKILELRIKTLEKQEDSFSEKIKSLREEIINKKS